MKRLENLERILMFGGASKAASKKTGTKTTRKSKSTSSKSTAARAVEVAAAAAEAEALKPPKPPKASKGKGKGRKKNEKQPLTKLNDGFYNAGQITVAAFSVAEHFNYSIPKLMSALNRDDEGYSKYYGKDPKLLRPNFRFSRNYWHSSISYGTPG